MVNIRLFLRTLETPEFSTAQQKRRFITKATRFYEKNGVLYKRNGTKPPLTVITDPNTRLSILTQAHENLGHRQTQSVFRTLQNRFYWPNLYADIHHHCTSCHACQLRSTKRREVPTTPSVPTTIFSKIYIDVMNMPQGVNGHKFIVAARDDLTGTCEAMAMRKNNSHNLAKFFWDYIYCRYGIPLQIVTDNGPEVRKAFKKLTRRLGVPHVRISPYNKHANGVVERGHFTLREALLKSCEGNIRQWPNLLSAAVFADRVTVSKVTGFSPYQLLHATDPIMPFDLFEATFLVDGYHSGMTTSELFALRIRQISKHQEDIDQAADTLKNARFQSRSQFIKRYHKKLQKDYYAPGEKVLVRNSAVDQNLTAKYQDRYFGPYEVVNKTQGGAYILKEVDGTVMVKRIAAFRLLPYIDCNHWFMKTGWMGNDSDVRTTTSDEDSSTEDSPDTSVTDR